MIQAIALLAGLSTSADAENAPRKRFEVEAHRDIAYRTGDGADKVKHTLDVYAPKGQKDFPVVFFVHGGGWQMGSKEMHAKVGDVFAPSGIGAVVINYRLSPQVKHPGHIEDVAKAFAWTHANIAKYGGKPDRIVIAGHSAGAYLVALLATDPSHLKAEKLDPSAIRGVVPISGVYTIVPSVKMLKNVFGDDAAVCKAASPMEYANGKHPPMLIPYADKDFPTCDLMSEQFCTKLTKGGSTAKSLKVENRNHITILTDMMKAGDPLTEAVYEFIAKHTEWKKP